MQIKTFANGLGQWRAAVTFPHSLSETDYRRGYNLQRQLPNFRRKARLAIIDEITSREQKTTESFDEARARVKASLGNLRIVAQNIDSMNRWHGVTFGE